jgi:hypothetical protein
MCRHRPTLILSGSLRLELTGLSEDLSTDDGHEI